MPVPHIVVIVVDRLGSGWLGPYGNAWIPTPALNHLAAQSALCEFMVSDSFELAQVYRSYSSGVPAWRTSESPQPPLPQLARDAGYETLLVTDAEEVAHHPLAGTFAHIDLLTWQRAAATAAQASQTRLGDVLATAGEAIGKFKGPKLVWVHAAGMNAAWDAPRELRERVTADDDPTPQDFVTPPSLVLERNYDPDDLLGIVQAYAAEVVAFDENLGRMLATLDAVCDPAETLLVLTSPRGYALGEHLGIGAAGDALHGELLQVPMLIRHPSAAMRLLRQRGLHQPSDLHRLIANAIQADQAVDFADHAHSLVVSSAAGELGLRTEHWFYRQHGEESERLQQLYAKPDDRWEVNEVSQRAADVVEAFGELGEWVEAHRGLPDSPALPDLPETIAAARR